MSKSDMITFNQFNLDIQPGEVRLTRGKNYFTLECISPSQRADINLQDAEVKEIIKVALGAFLKEDHEKAMLFIHKMLVEHNLIICDRVNLRG